MMKETKCKECKFLPYRHRSMSNRSSTGATINETVKDKNGNKKTISCSGYKPTAAGAKLLGISVWQDKDDAW